MCGKWLLFLSCVFLVIVFSINTGELHAQTPSRTTATYEDWTLRCEIQPNNAQKTCEIIQVSQQSQSSSWTIAIGRANKSDPYKIIAILPMNLSLQTSPRVSLEDKQPPVALAFKRCVPGGCFADADLSDDLLRRMRARAEPGRLEYKDAIQRDVGIPVSFKGFAQAVDALAKQ